MAMSKKDAAALFDDDSDDDLFVDAQESQGASGGGDAASKLGKAREALGAAGVDTVLTSIPQLTAKNVKIDDAEPIICELCNTFLTAQAMRTMTASGVMFMLRSGVGDVLLPLDKQFIDSVINLTHFEDELTENNSPKVDMFDNDFVKTITAVMVKTSYLVKGWQAKDFTPEFVSSFEYQSACQPGKPVHVPDMPPNQMRFTKTIIPVVYKVTIQFDVSEVTNAADLSKLEETFGLRIDKAILLERTKRRIEIVDSTLKCKSVLLYHDLDDGSGCLIIGATAILNTSIPSIAAKVLSNSSTMASREASDTAKLTRAYLQSKKP